MGNLCGKTSKQDNFSTPGRVVGAAPPTPETTAPTSKIPASKGRTLGGSASSASKPTTGEDEARRKAAEAAEARAQAATKASKQGKLSGQLAEQKKQTRTDTLNQVSEENRRLRDMDAAAQTQNYN